MDSFIGQIMMFAGPFAPVNWALCNGQTLQISEYPPLFSILGPTYGGDGRTTFGLPDLRGRVPMGSGVGIGLSPRVTGQRYGSENVTLSVAQMPAHSHSAETTISGSSVAAKLNAAHDNIQPSLAMNYIICVNGVYPSRN